MKKVTLILILAAAVTLLPACSMLKGAVLGSQAMQDSIAVRTVRRIDSLIIKNLNSSQPVKKDTVKK